nr:hypothetical protein [Tanacetum cinerariifolium]
MDIHPPNLDTMAYVIVNVPTDQAPTMAPPTRSDDQILPHIRWVPIGKINCYLDVEKSQSNPIYKITIDSLKPTNLFRAFTASSTISSIYIQQFWDTVRYDKTAGCYKCQLDEHWKHKFHPRPDSPLHLPNEEPVLRYLKFSAKGTKREVLGMPIPGNLIIANIQGEPYYQEYLEKVAKHQRYLIGEQGSDPDSPAPKPTKATKRSSRQRLRQIQGHHSLRSVDESVAKGIPEKEPRFNDEKADVRRALEESLKSIYDAPWGPLPPVVIREPESGKYQPLLEVQGKGKEKVTNEQVSLDLLTLQTPKKKSPADQFIFQRRTSTPTGSSSHDESLSLYAKLGLTDSEAGPDPDEQDEGQAGPNLGDAAASQPLPSPVVHAGPNLEHIDLKVTYVSTQPHPKQMDKGFTATAYPKVQENLKLTVEEQVILEEPASSTGTLSSLQHLVKDLSFGDLFFNDKPSKADNEKTTTETKAELMMSITIQQDTSVIPPMTTPVIDLTSRLESPNVHRPLQATATETTTTTTTIHPPPPQP